jgi:lysophospholipase L1-like esterase
MPCAQRKEAIMRRRLFTLALPMLVLALAVAGCRAADPQRPIDTAAHTGTVRVACVGDSITYGAGIKDREHKSYPAQLGRMLGETWDVRNFGVSGATLLKKGDKPYWKQKAFKDALAFRPHVVIIKLGTNDTKPQNWKHQAEFAADYEAMVDQFRTLDPAPRIFLCRPVPAFPGRWGIRDEIVREGVIPLVDRVAKAKQTGVIDLYKALDGKKEFFPDTVHPNAEGAGVMAKTIAGVLTGKE